MAQTMDRMALLALSILTFCVTSGKSLAAPPGPFPIVQGATDKTSTQIAVILPKDLKVQFTLRESSKDGLIQQSNQDRYERSTSGFVVEQIRYSGLSLGTEYRFEVVGANGEIFDSRLLKTLDLDDVTTNITVISCMRDSFKQETLDEMSEALIGSKPKVLFLIGDNVYASTIGPVDGAKVWDRYIETRKKLKIFTAENLIPTFAVWDDHDYGDNDGDAKYANKQSSKEVFEAMFAQKEIPGVWLRGPGVSGLLKAFGQNFYFMDGRYFKGESGRSGTKTQWGLEQEDWLLSHMSEARTPVWLINGTQFFSNYVFTENYKKEFKSSLSKITSLLGKYPVPVMFMSGDVHFSENTQVSNQYLGYPTVEVTSSGFLAKRPPFPLPLPPNKKRLNGAFKNNFITISPIAMTGQFAASVVTAYGKGRKTLYRDFLLVVR